MVDAFNSFDAIVMLTWSNWHTEMRSNRYHYATRFAKHHPVIFVQPDLDKFIYHYETIQDDFSILHVPSIYDDQCVSLLNHALLSKKSIRPLLWAYNPFFYKFIKQKYAAMKVYHATEDYFCSDFLRDSEAGKLLNTLKHSLSYTNLLVSVSEGVEESYCTTGGYKGEKLLLTNGCDFDFYDFRKHGTQGVECKKKVAFYQGGINKKINFKLLYELINKMSDWEFWFCGESLSVDGWREIVGLKNVKYLGNLTPEMIREYAYGATVGLIPFVENDWITNRSFPLKSFEYLACGLPVISVPIKSLLNYPDLFYFAKTTEEFEQQIRLAAQTRLLPECIERRLQEAKKHSYDDKFTLLIDKINSLMSNPL